MTGNALDVFEQAPLATQGTSRKLHVRLVLLLAAAAVLPYLRAPTLPLISDDYLVIHLARQYGPVSAWPQLLADPLYSNRATSMLLTYWIDALFGPSSLAFSLINLALHIANTLLVLAFGAFPVIGWRLSGYAALFFALYEGHQEAVIWLSAQPELLVFFFGLGSLWLWMKWLERGAALHYVGAVASFLLALLSKESAVSIFPLMVLAGFFICSCRRRAAWGLSLFLLLTLGYVFLVFSGQSGNQHFRDGTFDLRAPFWLTLRNSTGRLLWFWGALSLAATLYWRPPRWRAAVAGVFSWTTITLLPYSFLTYMPRVPSRHTYLASAGLAFLVALGLRETMRRIPQRRAWLGSVLLAVLAAHNAGYVWFYKHGQFVERAAPTEELIRFVSQGDGPVYVESFPFPPHIAELCVEIAAGKPRSSVIVKPSQKHLARRIFTRK